jgi:uncharacterized protein (DUF1800 family)
MLGGCGGGSSTAGGASGTTPDATIQMAAQYRGVAVAPHPTVDPSATDQLDAVRLADQATFGPNEAVVADIKANGPRKWIADQMQLGLSVYTTGGDDSIHKNTSRTEFCQQAAHASDTCWEWWFSTQPLLWDFYRNALNQPDQLRQRVAFALQQILVVSGVEVAGTYGLRNYHNELLKGAFGNYRDLLKKVALSPVMGDYLNNVNNQAIAPNENFARELLQLFSLGPCALNADGTLQGGVCTPIYDTDMVRQYAYALTGWTYPSGGLAAGGTCWPAGTHCTYYNGDMEAVDSLHDTQARTLLGGYTVPANSTPQQALEVVLDSLMHHPNMAPFIAKQLIQHFVTSNPSAAYVSRVAQAFRDGAYQGFGAGRTGDLAATIAAVLLDPEARNEHPPADFGKLREPALFMAGALRALHGTTDGGPLGWWWGEAMQQHVFMPATVFSFYPPDYPVAGTSLVGPAFGILNANSGLQRLNYLMYLLWWGGSKPTADEPASLQASTAVDLSGYAAQASDVEGLVDRLSQTLLGQPLPSASRDAVIQAALAYDTNTTNWQLMRARTVAFLILASPQYQIIH